LIFISFLSTRPVRLRRRRASFLGCVVAIRLVAAAILTLLRLLLSLCFFFLAFSALFFSAH
jgi:hypothetical protein